MSSAAAAAREQALDPRYYGVVEGLVVKNTGDPDKEGRIQVKFPWFDDKFVTDWCRVAQPYAGGGYGCFFIPEEGDEVIVGFIQGDMRIPIILGGLYNGQDKPPSRRETNRDQKMLRTKAGHEILLDDTSSSRRVRITTKGKHTADLSDKDKSVTVKSAGGLSVVMDDNAKTITVDTGTGASMKYEGSSNTITITGMTVKVSANQAEIGASQITLGGAAATQPLVLGTLFMTLFNAHVHTTTLPGFPTSPPVTPMLPAMLSTVTKTV